MIQILFLFFEHKRLYRSIRSTTSDKCILIDIEKANVVREGSDVSIITYGLGVHWATEISDKYSERGIDFEIVDLRSLAPIDWKNSSSIRSKNRKSVALAGTVRNFGAHERDFIRNYGEKF